MRVSVVRPGELGSPEQRLWSDIQRSDFCYASPCLAPQFTCAAAAGRDDVFVGVMEDGNQIIGFFPFQRNERGEADIGLQRMADYEAVVARREAEWSAEDLLRGCRLAGWTYIALIVSHQQLYRYHRELYRTPILDLRRGFQSYLNDVRRPGSRMLKHLTGQRRALERDFGPLRFELHDGGSQAFRWLKKQKTAHYQRTGLPDRFEFPWVKAMLDQIHDTQEADFAGTLSLLYAGEHVVAGHFGVRSSTAWHYWFPSYDRRFAKYSPGSLLLLEMAANAHTLGVQYIDLGRGTEEYKGKFMNGGIPVASGAIVVNGGPDD
jgi:CelD/BcsL family acetyltransferase involved in cellulose biosynthesis